MITKYGEVTISKDDNGEDRIFIDNFVLDRSDIKNNAHNALGLAAAKWATQVLINALYKIVEDTEA